MMSAASFTTIKAQVCVQHCSAYAAKLSERVNYWYASFLLRCILAPTTLGHNVFGKSIDTEK